MDVYVGFDSAWADNPINPGAICAVAVFEGRPVRFHPPILVSFGGALDFISSVRAAASCTLLALDQPTIVPNLTSMRPVERTAASLVSWLGGGVQPSNRGKTGMFCNASPIWKFLASLGATEDPEVARCAEAGLYVMEVFPALALPSIEKRFFGRLSAPRYNPQRRKTFRSADWISVAQATAKAFVELGFGDQAGWCFEAMTLPRPNKADQDKLDSMICLLIALRWRLRKRSESMMLGCLAQGYIVLPASAEVRERLVAAARKCEVEVDGAIP